MQRTRAVVLTLVVALILAGLASFAAYRYLQEQERKIEQAKAELELVVVAATDIPAGEPLIQEQIETVSWPKTNLPRGGVNNPMLVLGRLAIKDFVAGEPILESKLAPSDGTGGVMNYIIPDGKRAITVAVDQVSGVSGFVLPDSRVDVIVTVDPPGGSKQSRTILQDMRVLAVGQIIDQREGKPVTVPTVTLAVTPDEAERMAMASTEGRLQLALRKFGDQEEVQTRGVTVWQMMTPPGAAPPKTRVVKKPSPTPKPVAKPAPPPPATRKIEVIRAGKGDVKKQEETFVQTPQGEWKKK
jgi:pilus assembly protein CpaB